MNRNIVPDGTRQVDRDVEEDETTARLNLVIDALKGLDRQQRYRIMKTAEMFYGLNDQSKKQDGIQFR